MVDCHQPWKFGLPTEAEWDYACRVEQIPTIGGEILKTKFIFPPTIIKANKSICSSSRSIPIKTPSFTICMEMSISGVHLIPKLFKGLLVKIAKWPPKTDLKNHSRRITYFLTSGYRLYMDTWDNHDSHGLKTRICIWGGFRNYTMRKI